MSARFHAGLALALAACSGTSGPEPVLMPAATEPRGVLVVEGAHDFELGRVPDSELDVEPRVLRLHNRGNAPLYWLPQTSASWLRFTPSFGQLGPGRSLELTVEVDERKAGKVPPGRHLAEVAIVDRSRGRAAGRFSAAYWNGVNLENGTWLRVGASRFLPIFVVGEAPTDARMSYWRSLGVNTWLEQTDEASDDGSTDLLERCAEHDLYAVVRPHSRLGSHPALLAFRIGSGDDPLAGPPERLLEEREGARRANPALPTLVACAAVDTAALERPAWVELAALGLPPAGAPSTSATTVAPSGAAGSSPPPRPARGHAPRPIWSLVPLDDVPGATTSVGRRLRHAAWSALVRGATGIGYAASGSSAGGSGPGAATPRLAEAVERALVELHAELAGVAGEILAPAAPLAVRVEGPGADRVAWAVRRSEDGMLLFVVHDGTAESARVTFRLERPLRSVESRSADAGFEPLANGFADELAPLDCRVYSLRF